MIEVKQEVKECLLKVFNDKAKGELDHHIAHRLSKF